MRDIEKVDPRRQKLIQLMAEAYMYGAADSMDFYLYARTYMEGVDFKEVDEFVNSHFEKDMNYNERAPEEATLH